VAGADRTHRKTGFVRTIHEHAPSSGIARDADADGDLDEQLDASAAHPCRGIAPIPTRIVGNRFDIDRLFQFHRHKPFNSI
jgi:hypothetical protein